MKLYLIDANVLISAQEFYYPRERIPQYWDWLLELSKQDKIEMPSNESSYRALPLTGLTIFSKSYAEGTLLMLKG